MIKIPLWKITGLITRGRMIDYEFYKIKYKDYYPTIVCEQGSDSIPNSNIRFKGVWDCRKKELVVPIKYTHLTLYDGDTDFNAVVGEEYTNEYGIRSIQYGLIYNGKMVLPCNNKEIQVLSRNLFVIKEQERFCLISNGMKRGVYSAISLSTIYGKKEILIEDEDNYQSYKTCHYAYYCAIIHEGGKKGLYSPDKDILIEPKFNEIYPLIEQNFILADNILYKILGNSLEKVKDMEGYTYIGGVEKCHLFHINGENKYNKDSYIYLWLNKGNYRDCYDIRYAEEYFGKDAYEIKLVQDWRYNPILFLGGYFYSIEENKFGKEISDFWAESDSSGYDNWNYERDTYYALGGSDYDKWKDEGGDLDSMMDSMGY